MSRFVLKDMSKVASSAINKQCKISLVIPQRSSQINWNDMNFPPYLKLFHFRLSELEGSEKRLILKLYLAWILLISVLVVNIFSTFVLSVSILSGVNIIYSFLNFFILSSSGTLVFYLGYSGIAKRKENYLFFFKITGGISALIYFLISILSFGAFNGWAKIHVINSHEGSVVNFGVFMCVVESLAYTALCALQSWTLYLVHTHDVIFM